MTMLAKIQKNSREEIRISIDDFKGVTLVNLRVWFEVDDGEMRPGRKGIAFRAELLPEILAALCRADVTLTEGN